MQEFKDKVVLITGSSKGIGKTTAHEFLKLGAKVVINGRNQESLKLTQEKFTKEGYNVLAINGDVADYTFCIQLIENIINSYGRLDYLINNAGLPMRGRFDEIVYEVIEKITASNFLSASYCSKAALNEIKKSKGSIVFISSLAGIRGLPNSSIYCASKMALKGLAQSLKIELSDTGIHVALIEVGLTENDPDKRIIGKDGKTQPVKGGKHHTQVDVARAIIRSIYRKQFRKTLTIAGKTLRIVQCISPGFVHYILNKTQKSKLYE